MENTRLVFPGSDAFMFCDPDESRVGYCVGGHPLYSLRMLSFRLGSDLVLKNTRQRGPLDQGEATHEP